MKAQDTKEILFIINPIAGTRSKKIIHELIELYIDPIKFKKKLYYTTGSGDAFRRAKKAITEKYDAVIAVGGDGTINEIGKALVKTNIPIGIIPVGSGNGLARHLKIPLDPKKAIETINAFNVDSIDYGIINDTPFFCTSGLGFDAVIGHKFAEESQRGFHTYVRTTLHEFFNYKPKKYTINADGRVFKERAFLITFANSGQYGNDAYIAPNADIRDGYLDVCIVSPFPKIAMFSIGLRLFSRQAHHSEFIKIFRAKHIEVKRKNTAEVHLDGEPAMMGKKLVIDAIHKGLQILVPYN